MYGDPDDAPACACHSSVPHDGQLELAEHVPGSHHPYFASTTGIILFRQFYLTVPQELADAARVDGATPMQYLWNILLPLSWTNVAALLVIEFVYMWNEYLWPNIATTDSGMRVAQIGLRMLYTSERGAAEWNIIMAGLLIIMLPPLLLLIVFRRQFAQGIAMQTTK